MKTTVNKQVTITVSPEEVAKSFIDNLDEYEIRNMVQDYLIEEIADYVYISIEEYDPTPEEFDKVFNIVSPRLKEIYNKEIEKLKKEEIDKLPDRRSILNWFDSILCNTYYDEIGFWLTSEELLDTILKNGNK